jgi:hypothetical protein
MPYAIIIDALDECFSAEEAARLVALLTEMLSGPELPIIHLIFTSRPEVHIRSAMQAGIHEISLTTRNNNTIQDVRFFLRASLDNVRTSRGAIFGRPPEPWPSDDEFETLIFKAGGLFVYAAMAINFISATRRHPKQRLTLLLREKSTVGADIDQLYRQIIATSDNPLVHCRMLASIIRLFHSVPLVELQSLFYDDQEILAMTLEIFSPVILNPPDGNGDVEIYHASLRDFISDPLRSKHYYVDATHTNEYLAICYLHLLLRETRRNPAYTYAQIIWGYHLSGAYPSSKLRHLLALFTKRCCFTSNYMDYYPLLRARETCLSLVSAPVMLRKWRVLTINRLEVDQEPVRHCDRLAYR